ncbi:MAG: MraY family glycosyltransferase [Bacteroidales bacterium]|nr:MraY family glycosyltransferase [Bacteroidales bacterium]
MLKYNVLDSSGGRKIHKGEKVNIGGAVIFLAFLTSYIIAMPQISNHDSIDLMIVFIAIVSCIVIVGIRDDMNSLTAKNKLIIEIIAIMFLCAIGIRIDNLYGFLGIYSLPNWISYSITIFFYIVILNTYNLIDGIDGQSATQAISVFVPLLIFFALIVPDKISVNTFGSTYFWSIICVSIIGAIIGFLKFNWEPSKVFMGDTGSISIGMILASVMIAAIQYNGAYGEEISILGFPVKSNIGVITSLFFIPLADTLRVFTHRILKGHSPFDPDKSHIHHYLLRTGASHAESALIVLSFSIIVSTIGIIASTILDDNIFIPLLILLYMLYVFTLSSVTKSRIKKMKKRRLCQMKLN